MSHDHLRPNPEQQILTRPHAKRSVEDVGGAVGKIKVVGHGTDLADEFVPFKLCGEGVEGFGVDGG